MSRKLMSDLVGVTFNDKKYGNPDPRVETRPKVKPIVRANTDKPKCMSDSIRGGSSQGLVHGFYSQINCNSGGSKK